MKYEKGDKFIIEIKSKLANGLYKIKDFNTLVFDDTGLDRLEQVKEHNGCDGCKFLYAPKEDYPCFDCIHNFIDRWTPKPEEIQVGDEVEHEDGRKGVVVKVHNHSVCPLLFTSMTSIEVVLWSKEACHRTGKTYPELIKALEELPKEGE